jgi:hypothetical protein
MGGEGRNEGDAKMCEPKPITGDEVYRTLRELVVRMDVTAKSEPKAETIEGLTKQLGWVAAIDKLIDAMDAVK